MKLEQAQSILALNAEKEQKCVYTVSDLAILFDMTTADALLVITSLVTENILQEAVENTVYVYEAANSFDVSNIREKIAVALRRGENMYVSMQTVLSDYQIISQISVALTIVTDGETEIVKSKYGYINFYNLARPMSHLHADTKVMNGADGMRVAGAFLALSDLMKVAPEEVCNVDMEEFEDVVEEEYTEEQIKNIKNLL